jgi:hypothetical protein
MAPQPLLAQHMCGHSHVRTDKYVVDLHGNYAPSQGNRTISTSYLGAVDPGHRRRVPGVGWHARP